MSVSVPSGYRQGFVVLEDEPRLPALLPEDDRRWNGFAMPLFDPAIFEVEANRKILEQMFPKDPTNEDALILTWAGNKPSIVDPQYVDEADGGEYVTEFVKDGVTLLDIGAGAFVWSEDPVVGYEVRNEHDEPMIYCAVCASEKTKPVTRSQIAEEGELCAGTDFNHPSAHDLEPEENLISVVTVEVTADAPGVIYPKNVTDGTGRVWTWSEAWGGYRAEGMATHGFDTIDQQWGIAPENVTQIDVVREVRGSYPAPLLADAIRELDAACVEHGVDGFDGEAVSYLSALLIMAEHGHSAEDALVTAYGLKALPKAGA